MKIIFNVLFLFSMLFCTGCSCSNDEQSAIEDARQEKLEQELETQKLLVTYQVDQWENIEGLSKEEVRDARQQMVEYSEKGFFGKYWPFPFIVAYITIFLIISPDKDREKPISSLKVYGIWLLSGLFGGHLCYLTSYGKHYMVKKRDLFYRWLILSSVVFVLLQAWELYPVLSELFFSPKVLYFYLTECYWPNLCVTAPVKAILLLGIMVYYTYFSLFFIPYWVYIHNARFFRHHFENLLILNNRNNHIDKVCSKLSSRMKKINKDMDEINEAVSKYMIIEDPDKDHSFMASVGRGFKNIVTLGASGELEDAKDRLRCLSQCCTTIEFSFEDIEDMEEKLKKALKDTRQAAYRNLYLAKELIAQVKDKVSAEKQVLKKDQMVKLKNTEDIPVCDHLANNHVDFRTDEILSNLGNQMESALDSFNKKLDEGKSFGKEDLEGETFVVGINFVVDSIEHILDYNTNVREQRKKVEETISKALKYIEDGNNAICVFEATLLRYLELLSSLNQCNKAFVKAYEPLCNKVFGSPNFLKYTFESSKRNKLCESTEFEGDLQHLIQLCSVYNKVNQSKV